MLKNILITGASSGFGRDTAETLAHAGHQVFAPCATSPSAIGPMPALTDSYRYELSKLGIDVVLVQPSNYSTNIFASAQRPADAARGPGYGEIGAIPDRMVETSMALFESDNAPNPHDVAEAIARIVEQPSGTRPAGLVVGQSFGADAINAQAVSVQAQLMKDLGLGQFAEPRTGAPAA
ncbi:SDR family NAD(P)-dependent oxidoreductase [Paraburkholderia xenovorans]|uniref:SDR family NAD(P)-dependent oxidoreductase n=1 Tax=Paraburkholderia xenovorans TaxID=36873 RepID=UPI0038B93C3D